MNKMEKGIVNKIIKFSNVDGPGNRMAIFFQGCNLNCLSCHNPETIGFCNNCGSCIKICPEKALKKDTNKKIKWNSKLCIECDMCIKSCPNGASPRVKLYTVEELIFEIEKVKSFIKGITVSGGECSLQSEFIAELFLQVKKRFPKLTCFVDTNGKEDFTQVKYKKFVDLADKFMLDIKAWDEDEHIKLTGFTNKNIIKNLFYLKELDKLFEVRTVVIPEFLNNKMTIENVSKIIQDKNIRYKIIKYRKLGVRKENLIGINSPTKDELEFLEEICKENHVKDIVII
ncbi:MAG: YjjW family glycine radical enzyme activase [Cetobacterium sp.]|nr:YjjW family glycine radical enzyme activase [Cetobacterium sp.]